MAGRGAVSQSGQGWFPQPWWLIARLRYCRPTYACVRARARVSKYAHAVSIIIGCWVTAKGHFSARQKEAMLRVTPSLLRPLRSHLLAGMAAQGARGRELSSAAAARAPIKHVAVIGSGLMGSGIAQVSSGQTRTHLYFFFSLSATIGLCLGVCEHISELLMACCLQLLSVQVAAQTGHNVSLVDVKEELLDRARAAISASVQRVVKKTFSEDPKVSSDWHTSFNHLHNVLPLNTL